MQDDGRLATDDVGGKEPCQYIILPSTPHRRVSIHETCSPHEVTLHLGQTCGYAARKFATEVREARDGIANIGKAAVEFPEAFCGCGWCVLESVKGGCLGHVPRAIAHPGQLSECGEAASGEGALGEKHTTANQPCTPSFINIHQSMAPVALVCAN